MNPVMGLDVAKGESQVQAFLEKKQPYKKRDYQHNYHYPPLKCKNNFMSPVIQPQFP